MEYETQEGEPNLTETQAAVLLAADISLENIEGVPYAFVPNRFSVHNLGELLPQPTRKIGTVVLHDVDSFIDFAKRQGSLTSSSIYLDVNYRQLKIKATAVFNDHSDKADEAGWRDHRAVYEPIVSSEWDTWIKMNTLSMEQEIFANFIEANIADITSPPNSNLPTGADMLTFVTALEETRKVKYGSAVNLQNGMVQIEFIEDGDAGQKGKLNLFREFAIGIRPFFNGSGYEMRAFLRYRIDRNTAQIKFWYELQRPDKVLEDAAKVVIEAIRTKTGMPVFFATP